MLTILRISPRGLEFKLSEISKTQTKAEWNGKSITVDASIETLSQAWYNWQMKGQLIQVAFPMLSNEQREFFLTGITTAEWDEIFKDEEDE
jgi:hypothetical protein